MNKLKIPPLAGIEKIICAGCFLLILIHLVASYFPFGRFWGVNLLFFLPPIWRGILLVSALLILFPNINKAVGNSLDGFARITRSSFKKVNKYDKYVFLSLLGGILFWVFKVKTFLLGDSYLRAREIQLGKKLSFTEPLDYLLHARIAGLLGWDAFQTYAVLSVVSGVIFLFLLCLMGDLLGKNNKERFFIFSVLITMGANQLFFGYVESYTLVYLAISVYLYFSLGYLNDKNGLILPILSFFLAFGLHLLALTLLPSLLYLIFSKRVEESRPEKKKVKWDKLILSAGMVLLVGLGLFLLQSYNPEKKGWSHFLIFPLGKGESSYSFFSSSHLLDLINHQLLVSPVGILIWLTFLLVFLKKIDLKDNIVRFLLVLSICILGFAFFMDPKLGYPRDWDLFAFTGLGYTILGIYVFLKSWRETNMGNLRYITLILLFTSLISTVPWIYVNATEKKSVARFEHLVDLDMQRSANGHEILALYYDMRGDWQKEIEQWEKAIALTSSTRYINNLAAVYYRLQRFDLALKELERSLELDPESDQTHFGLAEVFAGMGRYEEAIAEYQKAIRVKPQFTEYYENLGVLLTNLGRYQEAIKVFEEGLKENPRYFIIFRDLGYAYFYLGDSVQIERYLKLYLEYSPKAKDESEVRQVLMNLLRKQPQEP